MAVRTQCFGWERLTGLYLLREFRQLHSLTRFPTGTCPEEWRKNELKTIQQVILYHTHMLQIRRRYEISAYYCCTHRHAHYSQILLELRLRFRGQNMHGNSVELLLLAKSFLQMFLAMPPNIDICQYVNAWLCCGAHGEEGRSRTKSRTAD